ncbi:MAG: mitochondrial large ribosomal subunit protein uL15m [Candidatus Micrarchaeota archaeon]|nr:mitochondrial large ribosomal subunit protein uL15m [Candidatus Micrarchaeota archaeon]
MVVRKEKRKVRYYGTRRWGVGNIKNARGAGGRGGVGNAGARKHKFTRMTAKHPELLRKHIGFAPWKRHRLKEITLEQISRMTDPAKKEVEFRGYKVLSNGVLEIPLKIKATKFSKAAEEKIKSAGGEALVLEQ